MSPRTQERPNRRSPDRSRDRWRDSRYRDSSRERPGYRDRDQGRDWDRNRGRDRDSDRLRQRDASRDRRRDRYSDRYSADRHRREHDRYRDRSHRSYEPSRCGACRPLPCFHAPVLLAIILGWLSAFQITCSATPRCASPERDPAWWRCSPGQEHVSAWHSFSSDMWVQSRRKDDHGTPEHAKRSSERVSFQPSDLRVSASTCKYCCGHIIVSRAA